MTLSERSSLGAVAAAVAGALRSHGIPAVLTGGACATLYSEGAYHSRDLDFIVVGEATRASMNRAMGSIGFGRKGDRYIHSRARFYVEFPRGPLAIGGDYRIRPVSRSSYLLCWLAQRCWSGRLCSRQRAISPRRLRMSVMSRP